MLLVDFETGVGNLGGGGGCDVFGACDRSIDNVLLSVSGVIVVDLAFGSWGIRFMSGVGAALTISRHDGDFGVVAFWGCLLLVLSRGNVSEFVEPNRLSEYWYKSGSVWLDCVAVLCWEGPKRLSEYW